MSDPPIPSPLAMTPEQQSVKDAVEDAFWDQPVGEATDPAESDTPRTDAECWRETGSAYGEVCLAQFARRLERELAAANARITDLRLLCQRITRATDQEKREELLGHALRIATDAGCGPNILREATEGQAAARIAELEQALAKATEAFNAGSAHAAFEQVAAITRERDNWKSAYLNESPDSASKASLWAMRSALKELVQCKEAAGPAISDEPGYRWHDAWEKARSALTQPPPPVVRRDIAEGLAEALEDMLGGWRYIRQSHGDLYGVGWDRAQNAAAAALAKWRAEAKP